MVDEGPSAPPPEKRVIRWDRFLPRRSLRVLLVEHDDSTRHILTALLRKCSYHVAAVADGGKAWEVMKDKNYFFDLVLAEVAMPSLSGIGLLSRIMGTEECKNIPVIMMSSHDSVGVVLKCMLKGAVDFLVKPVRKNELQNLWQHVWRRHCASSYPNTSDNNAASNHISANASGKSETGENSDEGNNARRSHSKPEVDIERDQEQMEPLQVEVVNCNDEEQAKEEQVDQNLRMDHKEETRDEAGEIVAKVTPTVQDSFIVEKCHKTGSSYMTFPFREKFLDPGSYYHSNCQTEQSRGMNCLIGAIVNSTCCSPVLENDAPKKVVSGSGKSSRQKDTCNGGLPPVLELSLRRPQPNGFLTEEFKAQNILNHSVTSAFSRYGDRNIGSSDPNPTSALCIRTNNYIDQWTSQPSSDGKIAENTTSVSPKGKVSSLKTHEAQICLRVSSESNKYGGGFLSSDPPREDPCVGCSSNGEDSTIHCPHIGLISLPIPIGTSSPQPIYAGYNANLQPILYQETSLSPHGSTTVDNLAFPSSNKSFHQDNHPTSDLPTIQFHHIKEHQQPYHLRQPNGAEQDDEHRVPTCVPVEQTNHTGSCSQDIINASGSNGSSDTADAAINTGNFLERKESGVQVCNTKGLECDRSTRAAALIRFQLKRKDRCFEKKVRYYSRKKLAEQRPRIKGQFVRQKNVESSTLRDTEER